MSWRDMFLNKVVQGDCLELMKELPDKSIDLVLTDPPYGLKQSQILGGYTGVDSNYGLTRLGCVKWEDKPNSDIFDDIFRVSKNQIIFGFEHFSNLLPQSRGVVVWDKRLNEKNHNDYGDGELIFTSFNCPLRILRYLWMGFLKEKKGNEKIFHPTQKPLGVIRWILEKYSKEGDVVLDPFLGSGTTAVACKQLGRDFIGFELEQKYVDIANRRLQQSNIKSFETLDSF